ncbi:MAG: ABC transporter permease [Propionibacteriaceae bacterium]|jgi:ABC-2 type transport system permease protein|nr:ABC transporter permease [Propionibacteriaceae bacterium]
MTVLAPALPVLDPHAHARVTFPRLVRSELIKLRSLRATAWSGLILVLGCAGLALLVAVTTRDEGNTDAPGLALDQTTTVVHLLAPLVAVVMGVLFASVEYTSGAIRPTLAVTPRRWGVLGAKTVAAAAVLAVTSALTAGLTFAIFYGLYHARGFAVTLTAETAGRLGGLAFYGVVLGLIGFLLGFATRSAVAGIGTGLGVVFLLPILMTLASGRPLTDWLGAILPESAARQTWDWYLTPAPGGAWGGVGIALAWLAAGFLVTGVLFTRRDA